MVSQEGRTGVLRTSLRQMGVVTNCLTQMALANVCFKSKFPASNCLAESPGQQVCLRRHRAPSSGRPRETLPMGRNGSCSAGVSLNSKRILAWRVQMSAAGGWTWPLVSRDPRSRFAECRRQLVRDQPQSSGTSRRLGCTAVCGGREK